MRLPSFQSLGIPYWGLLIGIFIILVSCARQLDYKIVDRAQLVPITGSVERVSTYQVKDGANYSSHHQYVVVEIKDSTGDDCEMRQFFGATLYAPDLLKLQPGDNVTALVAPSGALAPPKLWDLEREGFPILSYEETTEFYQSEIREFRRWCFFGIVISAFSIFLRFFLGSWRT